MIKTQKIKLYPNSTMRKQIDRLISYRRYCWNRALSIWNDMNEESYLVKNNALQPNVDKVKDELVYNKQDWQYEMSDRILLFAVRDLNQAWNNFFNPAMPYHERPRYKPRKLGEGSFKTDQALLVSGKLRLDKPDENSSPWYDIRLAEEIRFKGELKLTTIIVEADGYYACFSIQSEERKTYKSEQFMTAVDVNIGHFDYLENKDFAQVKTIPEELSPLYEKISFYQRQLSRKRVANPENFKSKSYQRVKTKLERTNQKAERIQLDLLHKFTTKLVKTNDVIGIEDLDVRSMKTSISSKRLHRAMLGKFRLVLTYKAKWYKKRVIVADPHFPSTQRCSNCGNIKTDEDKLTLEGNKKHHTKHDEYICYNCGAEMNRDENAVLNLLCYTRKQLRF